MSREESGDRERKRKVDTTLDTTEGEEMAEIGEEREQQSPRGSSNEGREKAKRKKEEERGEETQVTAVAIEVILEGSRRPQLRVEGDENGTSDTHSAVVEGATRGDTDGQQSELANDERMFLIDPEDAHVVGLEVDGEEALPFDAVGYFGPNDARDRRIALCLAVNAGPAQDDIFLHPIFPVMRSYTLLWMRALYENRSRELDVADQSNDVFPLAAEHNELLRRILNEPVWEGIFYLLTCTRYKDSLESLGRLKDNLREPLEEAERLLRELRIYLRSMPDLPAHILSRRVGRLAVQCKHCGRLHPFSTENHQFPMRLDDVVYMLSMVCRRTSREATNEQIEDRGSLDNNQSNDAPPPASQPPHEGNDLPIANPNSPHRIHYVDGDAEPRELLDDGQPPAAPVSPGGNDGELLEYRPESRPSEQAGADAHGGPDEGQLPASPISPAGDDGDTLLTTPLNSPLLNGGVDGAAFTQIAVPVADNYGCEERPQEDTPRLSPADETKSEKMEQAVTVGSPSPPITPPTNSMNYTETSSGSAEFQAPQRPRVEHLPPLNFAQIDPRDIPDSTTNLAGTSIKPQCSRQPDDPTNHYAYDEFSSPSSWSSPSTDPRSPSPDPPMRDRSFQPYRPNRLVGQPLQHNVALQVAELHGDPQPAELNDAASQLAQLLAAPTPAVINFVHQLAGTLGATQPVLPQHGGDVENQEEEIIVVDDLEDPDIYALNEFVPIPATNPEEETESEMIRRAMANYDNDRGYF